MVTIWELLNEIGLFVIILVALQLYIAIISQYWNNYKRLTGDISQIFKDFLTNSKTKLTCNIQRRQNDVE